MGLVVWFLPQWHLAPMALLAAVVQFITLPFMRTFDVKYLKLPASLVNHRPLSHMGRSGKGKGDHKGR